jgi:hypothetical protein
LQAGNVAAAVADLEECIRLNPSDSKTFVRLANLFIGNGDVHRAQGVLQKGLALHPANAQLQGLLAQHSSGRKQTSPVMSPGGGVAHGTGSAMTWNSEESNQSVFCTTLPTSIQAGTSKDDYRWQRSTASGKYFAPKTSTVSSIEARQRKIRNKCMESNRRKQQKLVLQKQAILDQRAEEARIAQVEILRNLLLQFA